jgi:hypothetical protein
MMAHRVYHKKPEQVNSGQSVVPTARLPQRATLSSKAAMGGTDDDRTDKTDAVSVI